MITSCLISITGLSTFKQSYKIPRVLFVLLNILSPTVIFFLLSSCHLQFSLFSFYPVSYSYLCSPFLLSATVLLVLLLSCHLQFSFSSFHLSPTVLFFSPFILSPTVIYILLSSCQLQLSLFSFHPIAYSSLCSPVILTPSDYSSFVLHSSCHLQFFYIPHMMSPTFLVVLPFFSLL